MTRDDMDQVCSMNDLRDIYYDIMTIDVQDLTDMIYYDML